MMNLTYLMDYIQFQTFKTILSMLLKTLGYSKIPPVQIYPNKIKNRIVFKIKTGYELESSSPETMKLLGNAKKDIEKD